MEGATFANKNFVKLRYDFFPSSFKQINTKFTEWGLEFYTMLFRDLQEKKANGWWKKGWTIKAKTRKRKTSYHFSNGTLKMKHYRELQHSKHTCVDWRAQVMSGECVSQVVASWKLGSTCDSVWPGLACTCVDLRWLAMTCDHFDRDQICTQVNASFLPFGHPTQVQFAATCDYLRVRLTRALKPNKLLTPFN